MTGATERQRDILSALDRLSRRDGYPPTVRELGEATGISSTNGVNDHLKALEKKGLILREPGKSRTLRITADGIAELAGFGA